MAGGAESLGFLEGYSSVLQSHPLALLLTLEYSTMLEETFLLLLTDLKIVLCCEVLGLSMGAEGARSEGSAAAKHVLSAAAGHKAQNRLVASTHVQR